MKSLLAPDLVRHCAVDGYRFSVRVWSVPNPRARIALVHGIVSHGGWYLRGCSHLARAGFEVHALDRRGSGLNLKQRGDVPRYETWLSDVADYLKSLPAMRPTILLGVSWGGKFAAGFAMLHPGLVDAVGLLCPGLFAQQIPGPLKYLTMGGLSASGFGSLRVAIPLRDPALFTASPEWQSFIRSDPFALRRVTIRFALADRQLTRWIAQSPASIKKPALLALAGRDKIVDNRRTLEFFQRFGSPERTVLRYQDAEHTIQFEPEPGRFLDDLVHWLNDISARMESR
jgi:acylglycerol lipase